MRAGFVTLITPEITPEAAIDKAREWGYDGISWRVATPAAPVPGKVNFWAGNACSLAPETLRHTLPPLVRRAKAQGVQSPSVAAYYRCNQPAEIEAVMQAMHEAGVRDLRVSAPPPELHKPYNAHLEQLQRDVAQLETLAQKYGTRACIEQHHDSFLASSSACMRVVGGLDPRYIGVILDPGNTVAEGFEAYPLAVGMLGEYLAEVHVKNGKLIAGARRPSGMQEWAIEWCALDDGFADMDALAAALRDGGFSGYLMLEDFSNRAMDTRMPEGLNTLRRIIG